jgi:hypothetical protein
MKIVKTVKVKLTDEEREVIAQAQQILLDFESQCSATDEETLQDMYEQRLDGHTHDYALPTAIDLLDVILKGVEEEED